jgi:hypothetical protein
MKHYILPIDAYDGDTTSVELFSGGEVVEQLFCIVGVSATGASILDSGYRSREEAKEAWPDSI